MPNRLAFESSPYLLQHANNPVEWYPWGDEPFELANRLNKPVLVSIGYSSCHWCHVMEKQSFEHEAIAQVMNDNLVCIKVDREERPDVDHYYMEAVQAMGLNGGWPLNVFVLPNKQPFYGGTYFPPAQWVKLVEQIGKAFNENFEQLSESGSEFAKHLATTSIDKYSSKESLGFSPLLIQSAVLNLQKKFDKDWGGIDKAPKFPMPVIWEFLLLYSSTQKDKSKELVDFLVFTLSKISQGGIYDQIAGGFARYSVDKEWFAPHFEKMLYDNAQLISLFAQAYRFRPEPFLESCVKETFRWLETEMKDSEGGYFSALDADSEGMEGRFYVWTWEELEECFQQQPELLSLVKTVYNATNEGNWEHGFNILYRNKSEEEFSNQERELLALAKTMLLSRRGRRERPGLDDKVLCSWNALAISGLCESYLSFKDEVYLETAIRIATFVENFLFSNKQVLRIYHSGTAKQSAFLDDYALLIESYIKLYSCTFESAWLRKAKDLSEVVLKDFFDESDGFFFYSPVHNTELPSRQKELFDNVIPASNSTMCLNLLRLGQIFAEESYLKISEGMLNKIGHLIEKDLSYLSKWAYSYSLLLKPSKEVVVMGPLAIEWAKELQALLPYQLILASTKEEIGIPLFENRLPKDGTTYVYICQNNTCKLPLDNLVEAKKELGI